MNSETFVTTSSSHPISNKDKDVDVLAGIGNFQNSQDTSSPYHPSSAYHHLTHPISIQPLQHSPFTLVSKEDCHQSLTSTSLGGAFGDYNSPSTPRSSTSTIICLSTSRKRRSSTSMPRSTLFILVKYMVFLNWTLTGFWIIYNSSDYSKNAQIISEKITTMYENEIEKQSVVYGLIIYTIVISCITFFGLVGVCYENFCMTICLAFSYLIYIIFDIIANALIGVPFNNFMLLLQVLLVMTCINLFYLAWLIKSHDGRTSTRGDSRNPAHVDYYDNSQRFESIALT